MKLLVEIKCPSDWNQDYADLVKAVLKSNIGYSSSVEMIE
tara:strand:+ start:2443 stop:2562 length:120 start_codon:yes stop_codon:yes gene_type:complete